MDNVSGFWELLDALNGNRRTKRTRATATYSGTDSNGTPWVTFAGSSEPTPVRGSVTSELSMGDSVEVEVMNGKASIVGNGSQPSVSAKMVSRIVSDETSDAITEAQDNAVTAATEAQNATTIAEQAAANAQAAIDATDQHFFADDNGVHVSTEEDAPTGTRNILINSLGMILRKASTILAQFTDGEIAFYDGLGNAAANIVALFGANGAQVGKSSETHVSVNPQSVSIIGADTELIAIKPESWSSGEPTGGGVIRFNNSTWQYVAGSSNGSMSIGSNKNIYLYSGIRQTSTVGAHRDATLSVLLPVNTPGNTDAAFKLERTTKTESSVTSAELMRVQYDGSLAVQDKVIAGTDLYANGGTSKVRALGFKDSLTASDIPDISATYLSKAYGTYYGLNSSLSLSTSMQKLSLATFTGSGTSYSSNGINIDTAGVYLIIGTCYCTTGFTASDVFHLAIYKGSSSVCDVVTRMYSASPYETVTAQTVISCAANDVIYLYAQNQTASRGTVATRDNHGLSVIRIA